MEYCNICGIKHDDKCPEKELNPDALTDLYEACKDMERFVMYFQGDKVGEGDVYINRREWAKVEKAIAKAEGG